MEHKELGSTGVQVPEIGLGLWQYRGGPAPIHRAIELGGNLLDTAERYGTERVLGEALRERRAQAFVATKVAGEHLRYDDLLAAAEASLQRLGTGSIDLYQVHWPNSRVPIAETMRAMERLADQGLVKHIGVSNFSVGQLQEAQAALRNHPVVSNQVLYNLLDREIERELLAYCQQQNVTVIAYSPLAQAGLVGGRSWFRRSRALETLGAVAQETGKTQAQVALNWCIAHPNVIAIPKTNSVERVEENCAASGWRLSPEQLEALDAASR